MNRKNKSRVSWRTVYILGSIMILALVLFQNNSEPRVNIRTEPIITHSDKELQKRIDYLITHVTPTNIHPFLRPIRFKVGNRPGALGTLLLNRDGTTNLIITANHLFSETQPGSDYYEFAEMTPDGYGKFGGISHVIIDSMRTSAESHAIEDIAFAHIGDPSLITRTSKVHVSAQVGFQGNFGISKITPPIRVRYLVTGQELEIVGQLVNDKRVAMWVLLYESMNGESGGGMWSEEGKLYILSGTVVVTPKLRKDLEIPDKFRYITILSAVKIAW